MAVLTFPKLSETLAMGDMSEIFNDWKAAKKEKHASNRVASAQMLNDAGIVYESKAGGTHLIIGRKIDFWPGTGLWIERSNPGRKHRGVASLIQLVRASDKSEGGI